MTETPKCENCAFYADERTDDDGTVFGHCHLNPPAPRKMDEQAWKQYMWVLPLTKADSFCSSHIEKGLWP